MVTIYDVLASKDGVWLTAMRADWAADATRIEVLSPAGWQVTPYTVGQAHGSQARALELLCAWSWMRETWGDGLLRLQRRDRA